MADNIRAKLEALISDAGRFNAGKQEERERLSSLLRSRLDQLANLPSHPQISARRAELLNILQALTHP